MPRCRGARDVLPLLATASVTFINSCDVAAIAATGGLAVGSGAVLCAGLRDEDSVEQDAHLPYFERWH